MEKELILAIILQILVDFLLIMGAYKLLEGVAHPFRGILGAITGGVYSVICVLTGFGPFRGYILGILLSGFAAFAGGSMRSAILYCMLRVAMHGIISSQGKLEPLLWALALWSVWLYSVYVLGKRGRIVPIELRWGEKITRLQGLVDTGNSLRDPITGRQVLVVGADVANSLAGLTRKQLLSPVETVSQVPGLRLIPYKTVAQSGGMLLGMYLQNAKIGKHRCATVVAFAPQVLDEKGKYQALIGGMG